MDYAKKQFLAVLFAVVFWSLINAVAPPALVCYYGTWAKVHDLSAKNIPPDLCTHIIIAFADVTINPVGIQMHDPLDENTVIPQLRALKSKNHKLKIILSVGGWNHKTSRFRYISSKLDRLDLFSRSIIQFLRSRNLDGIDVAWEYPSDGKLFTTLLTALRNSFEAESVRYRSERLLLTAAVASNIKHSQIPYDVPALARLLDLAFLMTYDYNGVWQGRTGHNSPLYPWLDTGQTSEDRSINGSVTEWRDLGMPAEKLVVGLSLYGRYFRLASKFNTSVGAPAEWWTWPLTDPYRMICMYELPQLSIYWDEMSQVPYATDSIKWLSYDNVESITLKTQYAVKKGLSGVFVWSIDQDDYTGKCGFGKYPLVNAAKKVLFRNETRTNTLVLTTRNRGSGVSVDRQTSTDNIDYVTNNENNKNQYQFNKKSTQPHGTPMIEVTTKSKSISTTLSEIVNILLPDMVKKEITETTKETNLQTPFTNLHGNSVSNTVENVTEPVKISTTPSSNIDTENWSCLGAMTGYPVCSDTDVYVIVPCRCNIFIHCDHGRVHIKDCPANLVFDITTSRCDYSWVARRDDCNK